MQPNFTFESSFWNKSLNIIAGADEVGRGALAGPVVAAAVVFDPSSFSFSSGPFQGSQKTASDWMDQIVIRDSKKMTARQREISSVWIKENARAFGIGEASVNEINTLGIVGATNRAYRRAIAKMSCKIDHLIVDAFYVPRLPGLPKKNQTAIVRGDSLIFSISAASIIAKVYRDNLMCELSERFTSYLWDKNKGYGTAEHTKAIQSIGTCKHHRRDFVKMSLRLKPFAFRE